MSTADVEDLLTERGIGVSRETIRKWVNRFGQHFARCIRGDRPKPNSKWHLDEAVIVNGGVNYWLWRAIDGDGEVLDILVQPRRNAKAARRFFGGLVTQLASPGSW
ncbi:putative IS6 family transposase [Stappia aggregata IAM 12614]|uniref:Putative IS6 family transposase n=1 Tax=Roseibium aggregatum (strain ATCC 25650 / DSM 13394 / JCM 20685 / NBRC 16684 / NCIMB 2208 / IAM 12614 / B1) TaxID=384765 RepID=A0P0X8_ROSAI|nr:putative IS6 family transposase [Stappia aggregata IAM 12614] [Roseibium aggregatum IAM 12614]